MAARTAKTTARPGPAYRCTECGNQLPKWVGRCPECNAWGTVRGVRRRARSGPPPPDRSAPPARPIGQVDGQVATARSTGVGELDRVLGGGLVPGAVVLLAGEPGVGKSTLLLDVAAKAADAASTAPSTSPVRSRPARSGCAPTGSTPSPTISTWPPRPISARCSAMSTQVSRRAADPGLGADHRLRRARRRARAARRRSARWPSALIRASKDARHVARCWSATSPRTARSPDRACWSTWSTWCCTSRATGTPGCGYPGRQEPLRRDRRGGLLRTARRGHRRARRSVRALPDPP